MMKIWNSQEKGSIFIIIFFLKKFCILFFVYYLIRIKILCNEFEKEFGLEAEFLCRAPGRVNLIGEHIDYCGFGVLVNMILS